MKPLFFAPFAALAGLAALSPVTPAMAEDNVAAPSLAEVLAHERRDNDRARDQYRNPAETLAFFQVEPTHTVVEYGPGGGWYTRVLAPYLMPAGKYMAINQDSDGRNYRTRAQEARTKSWTENFKSGLAEAMGIEADAVTAFETDEMPEDVAGTVDRVLIFRSMHGLVNGNRADEVLGVIRTMLEDDGMVGVVQHRAPEGASFDDYNPVPGYIPTERLLSVFTAAGFELVASSEINANPQDPANWERGVWTLPPVLATGEDDPRRSEYLSIGESDRMTLLFKKAN